LTLLMSLSFLVIKNILMTLMRQFLEVYNFLHILAKRALKIKSYPNDSLSNSEIFETLP